MPGKASFQRTFFVALHSEGRLVSLQVPLLSGPRHCGQLSAWATATEKKIPQQELSNERMAVQRFIGYSFVREACSNAFERPCSGTPFVF